MHDDELLAAMRALKTDAVDPRLDALAEGRGAPDLLSTLSAQAQSDAELARDLALFAPLDDSFDDHLADLVLRKIEANAPVTVAPAAASDSVPTISPATVRPPNRRIWAVGVMGLLAAAALAFFMLRPTARPMPGAYQLEALSGEKAFRDDGAPVAIHGPGSTIKLLLRPDKDVASAVAASVWWTSGATAQRLDTPVRMQANGAGLLKMPVSDLPTAVAGTQRLLLVVAHPASLPTATHMPAAQLAEGAGWRVLQYRFERRLAP